MLEKANCCDNRCVAAMMLQGSGFYTTCRQMKRPECCKPGTPAEVPCIVQRIWSLRLEITAPVHQTYEHGFQSRCAVSLRSHAPQQQQQLDASWPDLETSNPTDPGMHVTTWKTVHSWKDILDGLQLHGQCSPAAAILTNCIDLARSQSSRHRAQHHFGTPASPGQQAMEAVMAGVWQYTAEQAPGMSAAQCAEVAYLTACLETSSAHVLPRSSNSAAMEDTIHMQEAAEALGHQAAPQPYQSAAAIVEHLIMQTNGNMHAVSSRALVDMAWACTAVRVCPNDSWWHELSRTISPNLSSLSGQHLARLLLALARAKQPGSSQQRSLASSTLSATEPQLSFMKPNDLVSLIWAVAELRLRPLAAWLTCYLAAVEACMHELQHFQLVKLALSLATARCAVPRSFCNLIALAAVACLSDMTVSQVSGLLWALGRLRVAIRWRVICALVDHFKTLAHTASPMDLARVVWALPIISSQYPEHLAKYRKYLLMVLAQSSLKLLPACTPRQLVQLIAGFTSLGYYPGAMWMKRHREACIQRQDQFDQLSRQQVRAAYQRLLKWS